MSSNILFELGTEELPPKALQNLSDALADELRTQLQESGLQFDAMHAYNSPRRLALLIENLSDTTPISESKVWGPPANIAFTDGKASKAALGFCARNKVDISEASIESDGKAEKLCILVKKGGQASTDLLPGFIESSLAKLPIPKRMRWGRQRMEFVRPVRWLVLMKDTQVIPASILGLQASNVTQGHRFLCEHALTINTATDYLTLLETQGKVIADPGARKALIREQVESLAKQHQGSAVIDADLLDEVNALVEWPVALIGKFEQRFLSVPAEALISSMKEHQKYFHMVDDAGRLMPHFITLTNLQGDPKTDNHAKIIAGNEKVIRPRLDDAAFFFETDKKVTSAERRERLKTIVYQAQLGTVFDKTERIKAICGFIAENLGMTSAQSQQVAELCKSDLVSNMVTEFSDMQGIAGYHYALHEGIQEDIALAIAEHYLPKFAGDALPSSDTGAMVAIADRVDTLVGIFGIGQTPSGSKDPFGLRRASVAVLRLIVENNYDLDLHALFEFAQSQMPSLPKSQDLVASVSSYVLERMRSSYDDKPDVSAEVINAVMAKALTRPLDIHQRILAVAEFNRGANAEALAAANKRVNNILAKLDAVPSGTVDHAQLVADEEKALAQALNVKVEAASPLFANGEFRQGLSLLADLRAPVDAFFEQVMVMDDNLDLRNNRLRMLAQLRGLFLEVADISLLVPSK